MYKIISLFFLLSSIALSTSAQIKQIIIKPEVFQFGDITNWKNQSATFIVVNNGGKPLVFLPTFPTADILVQLPTKPILKGQSDNITVTYYTPEPGSFQKEIKVYVNISDQPLILKIEGDILSISADAQINCPTVGSKTFAQQQSFVQNINIIDEKTQKPIIDAQVRILGNEAEYETKTNDEGIASSKIMLGLHDILVNKKGYKNDLRILYLNKNTGLITIALQQDTSIKTSTSIVNQLNVLSPDTSFAKINLDTSDTSVINDNVVISTTKQTAINNNQANLILSEEKYNPNNIVFLIDVSSSMKSADKMPLLKNSMKSLLQVLRGVDKFSMVTYAASATIVMNGINSDKKKVIGDKIDSLQNKGWTNGVKGIETAYQLAEKNYVFMGNNQLILATDGLFNNPNYDEQALINLVKKQSEKGITLSVIGFGNDTKALRLMKKLAFIGNGNFIQIKSINDCNNALINEIKLNSAK